MGEHAMRLKLQRWLLSCTRAGKRPGVRAKVGGWKRGQAANGASPQLGDRLRIEDAGGAMVRTTVESSRSGTTGMVLLPIFITVLAPTLGNAGVTRSLAVVDWSPARCITCQPTQQRPVSIRLEPLAASVPFRRRLELRWLEQHEDYGRSLSRPPEHWPLTRQTAPWPTSSDWLYSLSKPRN